MVSVTQYVLLIMLKRFFFIYELDYKHTHFVDALSGRARPHTLLIGCDIWLILSHHAVASRVVWTANLCFAGILSCRV